ncbi:hypothetical protein EHF33_11535 [Deinococcus psychrotolerans]|uniref:Uncharacterized protein n=1 Tax=Deinococcus psychrotolerans TaxID=2489213 RepID=A0A3G8YQ40_9DEIO|nr:hypothetical protein [Deinococcus psychrotolerans]AZI43296.1 hypothetical protein EHF33_11535 [Deinococcus psychrotolerans]
MQGSSGSATPKPPSYALGMLLNMVLPGSGFSYLGNWRKHLSWMQTFVWVIYADSYFWHLGLWVLVFPVLTWLAIQVNYHVMYGLWKLQGWPPLQNTNKVAVIGLHSLASVSIIAVMLAILLSMASNERQKSGESNLQNCAQRLKNIQIDYRKSRGIYANQNQLVGKYTLVCNGNFGMTQLAESTKDDFTFRLNDANQTNYFITPDSSSKNATFK